MASKRLVMGPSPGTGLFAHEPPAPPTLPGKAKKAMPQSISMADKEETRVNAQLVDMLEQRCSKYRTRLEEETQRRTTAEEQLARYTQELQEARFRLEERDRQVSEMCTDHESLVEERRASAGREEATSAALQQAEAARKTAESCLRECQKQLLKLREEAGRSEAEWKEQINVVVHEAQAAEQRTRTLERQLLEARAEIDTLKQRAQDVVLRYEEESAQRLTLEEKCLELEEKGRKGNQRVRSDITKAQEQSKLSQQARQRAEELSKQYEEQRHEAVRRAEEAEKKCRSLEAEVRRLRTSSPAAKDSLPPAGTGVCSSGSPSGLPCSGAAKPRALSSAVLTMGSSSGSLESSAQRVVSAPCTGEARRQPGAIRRAGSRAPADGPRLVPATPSASGTPPAARSGQPARQAVPKPRPPAPAAPVQGAARGRKAQPTKSPTRSQRPPAAGVAAGRVSRPSSCRSSRAPSDDDLALIDDTIPDQTDSSDEEVLSAVCRAK